MSEPKAAAFLDRDGVINVDHGYVGHVDDFVLVDGAPEAISLLNRNDIFVFVVTNQSGIGHGYFTEADFKIVSTYMDDLLAEKGAHVDDIRYCPFHPDAKLARYRGYHPWRKPAPGMILDLLAHWNVDAAASFLIGNSDRDVAAARAAGIDGHLFESGSLLEFLRGIKPGLDR